MSATTSKARTVIITGANKTTGIGYKIIEGLLSGSTPYNVILTTRTKENGEKAVTQLKLDFPNTTSTVSYRQLDIDSLSSIDEFVNWVKTDLKTYDVLVDNAALGASESKTGKINIIKTNLINTIVLTEKLLPYLSNDGKIIAISSTLGSLAYQSKKAREILEDPSLTTKRILEIADILIQSYDKEEQEPALGFRNNAYHITKALLNAYVRWGLTKEIKPEQQAYSLCPGWCRTEMGGDNAWRSAEEGAETPIYLINLPFKVNKETNGLFIRDLKPRAFDDTEIVPPGFAEVIDY